MWKVKQIFDGEYGCEELQPSEQPKLSITLENETGDIRYVSVTEKWLDANGVDEGSEWLPEYDEV